MILTTDVAYGDADAVAAGVLHRDWEAAEAERVIVKPIAEVASYEPGAFYKRELPCLLKLLEDVDGVLDAVVIDGYVTLGAEAAPGLGWHLHEALGGSIPVVGVAKSAFTGTPEDRRVFRADSRQPLFVTAIGMPLAQAKARVAGMHGQHRLPTMLKLADRAGREHLEALHALHDRG